MTESFGEKVAFILILILISFFLVKEGLNGIRQHKLIVPTENVFDSYIPVKGNSAIIFSIFYLFCALVSIGGVIYNIFSLFKSRF